MAFDRQLVKKSENLSEWYNKVVLMAELADYGPAKGTMIFRPYGFGIWEQVQTAMNPQIAAKGVENAYFPSLIPQSLLQKEANHVEGFSPELAVVTIGGGEELEEPLVVRPTSETIMYDAYSRWIQSYRDLPLAINQWNNVVRWEKRTYLFLRTSEFLWQEGHTAHATHEEGKEYQQWAMDMYAKIYRDYFALPGYVGYKSESERFAGADETLTYETLMPEGKALQSCTSHDLGQNFSKAFDISYQDNEGNKQYAWQTSWGLSTRSIGGLLMAHGDDKGLRLPPKLAPIQVIIIPIRADDAVMAEVTKISDELLAAGVRVRVDSRDGESLGFKINKWELKGVPIRLEVGAKELESGLVTLVRRDQDEKQSVELSKLAKTVVAELDEYQAALLREAEAFLAANTHDVDSFDEFKEIMTGKRGFVRAPWCEDVECEAKIKEQTKASTRCLELDAKTAEGNCFHCDRPAKHRWLFAVAY